MLCHKISNETAIYGYSMAQKTGSAVATVLKSRPRKKVRPTKIFPLRVGTLETMRPRVRVSILPFWESGPKALNDLDDPLPITPVLNGLPILAFCFIDCFVFYCNL